MIKVGLIGFNSLSHAKFILNSIIKQNELFEIVGYALPENEREKFPDLMRPLENYQEMTVSEILNNPQIDAVIIETEEIYLTKYAKMAAEYGKHIHMEKPGGTSLADFEELIGLVKKSGKVFHTGYMYRYNPIVAEVMNRIKRGELGEIISVEAQMNCWHNAENREWFNSFPGGIMFFLGCHLIDLILQIKGEPDNVISLNRSSGIDGITSTDLGMAVFEYKNGISFAKVYATETGGFNRRQLVVSGTKATVEIKPLEIFADGGQRTDITEYTDKFDWSARGTQKTSKIYDRYDAMMEAFAKMVKGEKENPYSYDYELMLYKYIYKVCNF